MTKLLAKTKSGYVKQSQNVTIKQTEGNIAIVLHNARLNLINRHFWITPSDWSITFSQLRITDTLIPYIPSRARDNTYFFTVVRGFPRTYRRHDLRTTFDRAATIDESMVLSAWCPDVHETFVSLFGWFSRRITKSRKKSLLLFPPYQNRSPLKHSCVILLSGIFQLCLRTARDGFRTEWVISANSFDDAQPRDFFST